MTRLDHNYQRIVKVEKGDIVLDAGAAEGLFSTSIIEEAGHIIIVEPKQNYYYSLQKIFKNINKVTLVNKALWNKIEKRELIHNGWSSNILSVSKKTELETDTIDNIISNVGFFKIDFIKMDIEGAEIEALEGANYTLDNTKKLVISAYHKRHDLNLRETCYIVEEILRNKGFYTIITKDKLVHAWRL